MTTGDFVIALNIGLGCCSIALAINFAADKLAEAIREYREKRV